MRFVLFVCLVVCSDVLALPPDDPTSVYSKKTICGFTVMVHPSVEKHPKQAKAAFVELESQIKKICDLMPEKHLAKLRDVKIWMIWEKKKRGAAEFHPSPGWLKANGYNLDKVRHVEINNIRNFVDWSKRAQPWMLLHEMAHAFHYRVLGIGHEGVKAAYEQAKERKLYDSVEYANGKKRKAYALTNRMEYFAEISEAYFGKNDFFPFNREQLKEHDPVGFALMEKTWGALRTSE